jgi:serine/threonine-protein kinase
MRRVLPGLAAVVALAGCGGGSSPARPSHPTPAVPVASRTPAPRPPRTGTPDPIALVTAETENRLLAVDLRTGRVIRRERMPRDPENVVAGGVAVVVSAASGTVTVLDPRSGHRYHEVSGFDSPHIPALVPGGDYAYVTDDAAGTLTAIGLTAGRRVATVAVGAGAHHLAFSPNGRRLMVALGESARTIVVLNTSDAARPRVIGRLHPGFSVHDLSYSPDGRRVWVTSAAGRDVAVLSARTHRLLFRVPVGPPPQHVAFTGGDAYLTSGYGRSIERVDGVSGRVLNTAATPYGSFELDAGQGYVVTSSLLRGTLTVFDPRLGARRVVRLAPATRDLAIWSS